MNKQERNENDWGFYVDIEKYKNIEQKVISMYNNDNNNTIYQRRQEIKKKEINPIELKPIEYNNESNNDLCNESNNNNIISTPLMIFTKILSLVITISFCVVCVVLIIIL